MSLCSAFHNSLSTVYLFDMQMFAVYYYDILRLVSKTPPLFI